MYFCGKKFGRCSETALRDPRYSFGYSSPGKPTPGKPTVARASDIPQGIGLQQTDSSPRNDPGAAKESVVLVEPMVDSMNVLEREAAQHEAAPHGAAQHEVQREVQREVQNEVQGENPNPSDVLEPLGAVVEPVEPKHEMNPNPANVPVPVVEPLGAAVEPTGAKLRDTEDAWFEAASTTQPRTTTRTSEPPTQLLDQDHIVGSWQQGSLGSDVSNAGVRGEQVTPSPWFDAED